MSVSNLKRRTTKKGSVPDSEIDFSDIPELDEEFWKHAKPIKPRPKKRICIRLDPYVLQWFRERGPGYQTEINAVLRSYVNACARK